MIRACLFDMGNVLVDFCHEQMLRQMAVVCDCEADELRLLLFESGQLLRYEQGLIDEDELHGLIEKHFARLIDRPTLRHAAADIFAERMDMHPLLDHLKQSGQTLVLLSNTSRVHFEFIRERFEFLKYFDACVLSYEVKSLKPEPEIYRAAVEAAGVSAGECFFTDDIEINIQAAREFGLKAAQYTTRPKLIEDLRDLSLSLPSGL